MTDRLAYDPYARAVQLDPYPFYTALREHAPVFRVESAGAWAISRFADATEVLKTPELFSSSSMQTFMAGGASQQAALRVRSHRGMSGITRAAGWLSGALGLRSSIIDAVQVLGKRSMISADPPEPGAMRLLESVALRGPTTLPVRFDPARGAAASESVRPVRSDRGVRHAQSAPAHGAEAR